MKSYITNIENDTLNNENFRKVLFTGKHSQLVVMTIEPGDDIGMEIHHDVDQFIRIEAGVAKTILDGEETVLGPDFAIVIPAGTEHNIINTSGTEKLRLYSVYSPREHADGTVHKTKEEAQNDEHHH